MQTIPKDLLSRNDLSQQMESKLITVYGAGGHDSKHCDCDLSGVARETRH